MDEHIVIVDERDKPIGSKSREMILQDDIYRVSSLWLTDDKTGKCLIAQRKWTKRKDPGKWGTAVSGTVAAGETYEANVRREIAEEIGINDIALRLGPKQYIDDGKHRLFCQWFLAQVNKDEVPIRFQEEEIEAIKWVDISTLVADVQAHPDRYTTLAEESLKLLGLS